MQTEQGCLIIKSLRELDALVAEYIFQREVEFVEPVRTGASLDNGTETPIFNDGKYKLADYDPKVDGISWHAAFDPTEVPRYSTSIADAWQVVDKLCPVLEQSADGWVEFSLEIEPPLKIAIFSKREIYQVAPEHRKTLGETDSRTVWRHEVHTTKSVPVAICLAALKNCGVDATLELSDG